MQSRWGRGLHPLLEADFIFQHTNGSLYIWYMNGAMLSSGSYLTPAVVNPAWQIVGPR